MFDFCMVDSQRFLEASYRKQRIAGGIDEIPRAELSRHSSVMTWAAND